MTTSSRSALLNKTHRVLKRTYKHAPHKGEQPVLESLLFACCLENTRYDVAREAFAKLQESFFDWNEIRVSTARELAEVMEKLGEPLEAATRLKSVLQCVFEADYSFELENLKKQNLGAAVKRLQKLQGATPFNVAFTTQMALGGHSIPVDKGTLAALHVLGAIGETELKEGVVPGMERAIPKSRGQEFGALLHELGAEFWANPFSTTVRELLLSIAPDARDRFPKRTTKKPPAPPAPPPAPAKAEAPAKKKDAAKESAGKKQPPKAAPKPAVREGRSTAQAKKKAAAPAKKPPAKTLAKRKPR